jgi:hypothetical protein
MTQGGGETLHVRTEPLGAGARKVGHTPRLPAYPMKLLTLLTQCWSAIGARLEPHINT